MEAQFDTRTGWTMSVSRLEAAPCRETTHQCPGSTVPVRKRHVRHHVLAILQFRNCAPLFSLPFLPSLSAFPPHAHGTLKHAHGGDGRTDSLPARSESEGLRRRVFLGSPRLPYASLQRGVFWKGAVVGTGARIAYNVRTSISCRA